MPMAAGATPLMITFSEGSPLVDVARQEGWHVVMAGEPLHAVERGNVAVIVVTDSAGPDAVASRSDALVIGTESMQEGVDVVIPRNASRATIARTLERAKRYWAARHSAEQLQDDLRLTREQMEKLADVGRVLSSQMEPDRLLETILTEARRLAGCEAGSLYLIDGEAHALMFKLAQNDVAAMAHDETRLPLSPASLAGYVALTGEELNIADAYRLSEDAPYRFNQSFDLRTGYRTRSMLVLPMRDHRGRVIGVLQFINCIARGGRESDPVPFDECVTGLLRAIASQAAVAIQKNSLLADISRLFESFVHASVKAVEQRDPSTSGHSFRVADTTLALFQALPSSGVSRFSNLAYSDEHLKEVRYAALLHDFGKIAVPERVLTKAHKLSDERIELLGYRFELQKERYRREAVRQELALLHRDPSSFDAGRRRIHQELERRISLLDDYFAAVLRANNPTMLEDGDFAHLRQIREHPFVDLRGAPSTLITDIDLEALSIRRGTLTPSERHEIEAHVVHTREFLSALPWPPELAGVPGIAAAHHEKLDGSGYPDGLAADAIPLPSRVMTVCDIFDALTAMDRPYKAAMPTAKALDVLQDEARRGLLDADIVRIFIDSRSYDACRNGVAASPEERGLTLATL
jgi:HD-GYP domain-containing protein (c-di-GMP phosphodiesterase class II)